MLIFTDLDGTLFDTDVSKPKYIDEWIEEFSNARPKDNAREIIEGLHNDGHKIIALSSRGLECEEFSDELHKISSASIIKNFKKTIMGLLSSVEHKYNAIVNILENPEIAKKLEVYNSNTPYILQKDVVLVDDNEGEIAIGMMGGVKSILFNPPEDFDKNEILQYFDSKTESRLRIAKDWNEVGELIRNWDKPKEVEKTPEL